MHTQRYSLAATGVFKQKLLKFGESFDSFLFLDNHGYESRWNKLDWMAAFDPITTLQQNADGTALHAVQAFMDQWRGYWKFGHLGYDLKNETDAGIASRHEDIIGFSDAGFFVPRYIIKAVDNGIEIICQSAENDSSQLFADINATTTCAEFSDAKVVLKPLCEKTEYIEIIGKIKEHIRRGDCYEINYCLHYLGDYLALEPTHLYQRLSAQSPNPFSSFYKQGHSFAICASPERYIMKEGKTLMSQPIKGTAPRGRNNAADNLQFQALQQSKKDQTENVMVVDLVRNDLSKVCKEGTVAVKELFGIYGYPHVFQMISTVAGELKESATLEKIIQATFPMGSMTGAPKRRVMELIDRYEHARRGLFSGAIGYINPQGDFDFNVVIRSILLNQQKNALHYAVGGGITWQSQARLEWEECQLKASAIRKVLGIA